MTKKAKTNDKATPPDERVRRIRQRLAKAIPRPECELDHRSPWELLVATILSAQSTDRTVNRVTPELFREFPTPASLADAPAERVEQLVKSTGFFRNKARAIQSMSRIVADEHDGVVPRDMDAVLALPGVARKTANLVLGVAYRVATGIVVDTHARRVAQRLELTSESDPVKIERDLCALFPRRSWIDTGHRLVLHGRYVCKSRGARCASCALNELCPEREADPEGGWTARARWEAELVAGSGAPD